MIVTPSQWMGDHVAITMDLPGGFYLVLDMDEAGWVAQLFMPGNMGAIESTDVGDLAVWLRAAEVIEIEEDAA